MDSTSRKLRFMRQVWTAHRRAHSEADRVFTTVGP